MCCKEAAYKAWNGSGGPWLVSLGLQGTADGGVAVLTGEEVHIVVDWAVSPELIIALARAAAPPPRAAES